MESIDFTESFQVGIEFYVNKIKELPSLGWLNDTRKVKGANPKDVLWLDKNANDQAYKVGGKKIAFVLPENIFGRLSIRTYTLMTKKRRDNTFKIKTFETMEEAKNWLKDSK
ncbi:MAG: hypothetical protein SFU25_04640 [Candidatus Caenarcaniphilales bacterium]|nr:hypothetical protein [Candidatus Caenarcaniphilales bacterium]